MGADQVVRHAYLGDLQGNLWRLDFHGGAPWSGASGDAKPVFVARDAQDLRQPISTKPRVVFASGGYLVLFGTGKFAEHADAAPGNFAPQSFYAIHDAASSGAVATRADLAQRKAKPAEGGGYTMEGGFFGYGSGGKKGWVLDFPDSDKSGERVVTDAVVLNGTVFFNSLIPGSDPCAAGGGRSYALATLTGMPAADVTGFVSTVGLLGAPLVLDIGYTRGPRNAIGARVVQRRHGVVNFGTGGSKGMASPAEGGDGVAALRAGRFSWREILNWQELRNAWTKK
jgi:type IV pilus assembly protein PilY1